jgi:excisionase family DNA binding protein
MLNGENSNKNYLEFDIIPRLLSASEVAEILRISKKTVNKLAREGRLGFVQVTAKDRRFTESQIQNYIKSLSKGPTEIRVDTLPKRDVSSPSKKGGGDSVRFSRRTLKEEMRQWH